MKARVVCLSLRNRRAASAEPTGRIVVRTLIGTLAEGIRARLRMPSRHTRARRSTYVAPADALLARALR